MRLAEKLQALRTQAGEQRGHGRALTKADIARLMRRELGADRALSAAYLSQLESGARSHMTERSRATLAAFYGVHPGYLVSDPEDPTTLPTGHSPEPFAGHHDLAVIARLAQKIRQQPDPYIAARAVEALLDLPPERWEALLSDKETGRNGRP